MLGIKLTDRKKNAWIRQQTKLTIVIQRTAELEWNQAGHIARATDNRWRNRLLEWRVRLGRRSVGRPNTRWKDKIKKSTGVIWIREAQNRERRKNMG